MKAGEDWFGHSKDDVIRTLQHLIRILIVKPLNDLWPNDKGRETHDASWRQSALSVKELMNRPILKLPYNLMNKIYIMMPLLKSGLCRGYYFHEVEHHYSQFINKPLFCIAGQRSFPNTNIMVERFNEALSRPTGAFVPKHIRIWWLMRVHVETRIRGFLGGVITPYHTWPSLPFNSSGNGGPMELYSQEFFETRA